MPAQDPILHTFFVDRGYGSLAPSANFFCPQLPQNTILDVVILASGTRKSHTEPYQASYAVFHENEAY